MARRFPSLAALLGLVAVAGYQNRERIGEFVRGLGGASPGGVLDAAKKVIASDTPVADIKGGLGELVDHFTKSGEGGKVDSWVASGPNAAISDGEMEKTLGPDLIDGLVKQTGLSREELLARLSKTLPEAVDKMTPDGRLPV